MTPKALILAALNRKSVAGFGVMEQRPMPAAFLVGMPFSAVMRRLKYLKIYKTKKRKLPRYYEPRNQDGTQPH